MLGAHALNAESIPDPGCVAPWLPCLNRVIPGARITTSLSWTGLFYIQCNLFGLG